MKINITMRYHFTPTGMTKIKKTITSEDMKKLEPSYISLQNVKWHNHFGKFSKLQT